MHSRTYDTMSLSENKLRSIMALATNSTVLGPKPGKCFSLIINSVSLDILISIINFR